MNFDRPPDENTRRFIRNLNPTPVYGEKHYVIHAIKNYTDDTPACTGRPLKDSMIVHLTADDVFNLSWMDRCSNCYYMKYSPLQTSPINQRRWTNA